MTDAPHIDPRSAPPARGPGADAARGAAKPGDGPVTKALALLDVIAASEAPMRFVALLDATPFPKATLHRMLKSLLAERMIAYDAQSQTYTLGLRLMRLAHAAWRRSSLVEAAAPALDRLRGEIDQTFHLAQLDAGQVLYLDKRDSSRAVSMFSSAGKVGPAHCTGVGKAMLAFLDPASLAEAISRQSFRRYTESTLTDAAALRADLDAIRARGLAYDREEHEPGIHCIAVPIRSARGALYGGLSVTSAVYHADLATLERCAPRLREAADEIAAQAEIRMTPTL